MRSARPLHPVELISARIDCEITPGEKRYLEAHLLECPLCSQRESVLQSIAVALATLPLAQPPAGGLDKLLDRLRCEQSEKAAIAVVPQEVAPPVPAPRRVPWRPFAIVTIAIGAIVAAYGLGRGPEPVSIDRVPEHDLRPPARAASCPTDTESVPAVSLAVEHEPRDIPAVSRAKSEPKAPPARRPDATAQEVAVEAVLSEPVAEDAPLPAASVADSAPEPASEPVLLPVIEFKKGGKRLPPEGERQLEEIAALLRDDESMALVIRGRGDDRGSLTKDAALGEKRAQIVLHHFETLGLDSSRLQAVGEPGGDQPGRVLFEATAR